VLVLPESAGNSLRRLSLRTSEDAALLLDVVLATLQEPMLILDSDLAVQSANPAFCGTFKVDVQQTMGRKLYELGDGRWNIPELRNKLDEVISSGAIITDYRVDQEFERIGRRIVLVSAHRSHRGGGDALIVLALHDNTEFEVTKEYSDKLVDALRHPFLVLDWDLRVKNANRAFYTTFKVEPSATEGRFVYELGNGQWNIPRLRDLLEEILPRNLAFDDFEVEHDFENIGYCIMVLNARRINHLKLILLVIEDVTEARRAAVQQRVVLGEAQHRVKNLLMNVRALSQLTLQSSSSLENFAESFDARLDSMARTQDLLLSEPGASALLHEIVRLELQALGAREDSMFSLHGPALRLSDRASHAFGMTVHELATNAGKYGALSKRAENGRVEITWSAHAMDSGDVNLNFRWREYGLVSRPGQDTSGFGMNVIRNSLPYLFGGSATLDFHHDGVECVIRVALPAAELSIVREKQA
jgi:two-component sensor histidine kinase/PAS domain-containing protein